MKYVDALKEVKNNLIDIINQNNLNYSRINNSFKKYDLNIQSEKANLADLVENVKHDFLNVILSSIGIYISEQNRETSWFIYYYIFLGYLFLYSGYTFIDEAKNYFSSINKCNDIQNDMDICKLESKILKTKNHILDIELNKLNIAIEFLDNLTEEEKIKFNIKK